MSIIFTFGVSEPCPNQRALRALRFDLHDAISRYLGWPPYDRKPIVERIGSAQMSDEDYLKEFGTEIQR